MSNIKCSSNRVPYSIHPCRSEYSFSTTVQLSIADYGIGGVRQGHVGYRPRLASRSSAAILTQRVT